MSLLEKVPPQSREAEMSVLGAMLMEESALVRALEILHPSYFYEEGHQHIFESIQALFEKNQPVDMVTVTEELRSRKQLENVGGASRLTQLVSQLPTAAHLEHYARIVKEKFLLRNLIHTSTQIVQESFEPSSDVNELVDRAEQMIFEIGQKQIEGRFYALKEIIHSSMETIDKLYQRREHVTGLASGFHEFDIKTAGLQPSDLIIVAGRPSMGKSAFVSSVCEHIGIVLKKPIAFFSLEMSKEQLVQRMLCSHAKIDAQKVRTGYLSHQDWPKLTSAAGKLSESPIYIDDTPAQTVLEVRAKARRLKMQNDLSLVVVDYLQLMQGVGRAESRQQEISEISRSLKALARELRVPVIAVSQLSRAVESRTGNRPQLSDLRESGAIEQDADVVVFLFREEYYSPSEENRNKAEAIIAKQRNGPTGSIELVFLKEWTRFENMEFHRVEEPAL
ncbi:MAG: replicative DNA helicase [Candidatus Omnitrophica bacterium]|nr:replicative DNA helicase [Candidatus Omnitrophota bacterium]MDD5671104.1 replicative DNA helicase [Candidatus Omnitrophota bacterium]